MAERDDEMQAAIATLSKALNEWGAVLARILMLVGLAISVTFSWDTVKAGINKNKEVNEAQERHMAASDAVVDGLRDKYYSLSGGIQAMNAKLDAVQSDVAAIKNNLMQARH